MRDDRRTLHTKSTFQPKPYSGGFVKSVLDFHTLAARHSASCFLNSFLREWKAHSFENFEAIAAHASELGPHISIPITSGEKLLLPVVAKSVLGRHQYRGDFHIERAGERMELSFEALVARLSDHLAAHFKTDRAKSEIFNKRVSESLRNIRFNLEARGEQVHSVEANDLDFKDAEQALLIGHNFHPTPKSRDEFSQEDMHAYSPEFGRGFPIDWFLVDPLLLIRKSAQTFNDLDWSTELLREEIQGSDGGSAEFSGEITELLARGYVPFPMHPWQLGRLLKDSVVADYIRAGRMVRLHHSQPDWFATSSLRSLYREKSAYMLKFSMSLKLTNSVRHMLIREIDRGLQLHDVLATPLGKKFSSEHPRFRVVSEPAYMCLKNQDGSALNESLVLCRENPFLKGNTRGQVVLATLAQDDPMAGDNLIVKAIKKFAAPPIRSDFSKQWFAAFLDVAVKPMVLAHADYGFVLGAHQQNLILELREGLPVGAFFRDCQGTGYTELGFRHFASDVPSITRENGNVLTDSMGHALFGYYLILNSTFNVITALSSSGFVTEAELLWMVKSFLMELRARGVHDSTFLDYLIESDELMHKGNFLCSFQSINENTTDDPLAIYTRVPNSISSASESF